MGLREGWDTPPLVSVWSHLCPRGQALGCWPFLWGSRERLGTAHVPCLGLTNGLGGAPHPAQAAPASLLGRKGDQDTWLLIPSQGVNQAPAERFKRWRLMRVTATVAADMRRAPCSLGDGMFVLPISYKRGQASGLWGSGRGPREEHEGHLQRVGRSRGCVAASGDCLAAGKGASLGCSEAAARSPPG